MHSTEELNKKIWFLGIGVVIVLGVIAVIYYSYTQAVGLEKCAEYGAVADKDLAQQLRDSGIFLGKTNYSFKDNTCYEDVNYGVDNPQVMGGPYSHGTVSYIENLYTHEQIDTCTIYVATDASTDHCKKYFSDFNRIFYHLY